MEGRRAVCFACELPTFLVPCVRKLYKYGYRISVRRVAVGGVMQKNFTKIRPYVTGLFVCYTVYKVNTFLKNNER